MKIKLVVGGPPKEEFADNVKLVNIEDLLKGEDFVYALSMDSQLGIRLKGNATTGYKWMHEIVGDCVEMSDSKYYMDKRGYTKPGGMMLTGVGGTRTMVFKPLKPSCNGTLKLAYAQPWNFPGFDKMGSQVKTVKFATDPEVHMV